MLLKVDERVEYFWCFFLFNCIIICLLTFVGHAVLVVIRVINGLRLSVLSIIGVQRADGSVGIRIQRVSGLSPSEPLR